MAQRTFTAFVLATGLALASGVSAQGVPARTNGSACQLALAERFELLPPEPLSEVEAAEIVYLREEEKLARDVYLTLSLSYELPLFDHIPRSEQAHMDLVALLIARYELTDPVGDNGIGVFTDAGLQALYSTLVENGQGSLEAALYVGATIEDMDLADLEATLETTDNFDFALIAQNLAAGSRNHLRAFVGALEQQGVTYEAQYIDSDALEAILEAPREVAVVYDEFGDVLASCQRQPGVGGGGGVRLGPGTDGSRVGPGDGTGDGGGEYGGNNGENGGDNGHVGPGDGTGSGDGTCDGTGPHGSGRS
jgi:hypothetical protein